MFTVPQARTKARRLLVRTRTAGCGHAAEAYADPDVRTHLRDGITWTTAPRPPA